MDDDIYFPKGIQISKIKVSSPYFVGKIKRVKIPEKKHFFGLFTSPSKSYLSVPEFSETLEEANAQTLEQVVALTNMFAYDRKYFFKDYELWKEGSIIVDFDNGYEKTYTFKTKEESDKIMSNLSKITNMVKV